MMEIPFDFQAFLEKKFTRWGREDCGFSAEFHPQVMPSDPRFGDFQVNGVLAYGKLQRSQPRLLAQRLLECAENAADFPQNWLSLSLAGAGFINCQLSEEARCQWLSTFRNGDDFRRASNFLSGKTILVDYSCPNSAKQMHVGHLRSLVIGDAIQRLLRFFGANMLRDNHIGDWGTQFGILIFQLQREAVDLDCVPPEEALELLEALYRRGCAATQDSPEALADARKILLELQSGNAFYLSLWKRINALSYHSFQQIYDLADVQFDWVLGESFYRDKVDRVYGELCETGVAEENQGALAVFHADHPRFAAQPFLVRKSDGASNYASTDLATILYRREHFGAEKIIYVTDARQQDHFQQLFLTIEKWFAAKDYDLPELCHVWFGTVCGEDGKAIKTRSGEPIRLKQLFAEAIRRAYEIVSEKSPQFSEEERKHIAEVVGVAAVKYGDLSQNRSSDYAFSWDKMLTFEGNTAPYLLYAVARIQAIFRKIGRSAADFENQKIRAIKTPQEIALARKLMFFPAILRQVLEDLRPHFLCTYLYELAGEFSSFYNGNRILGEEIEVMNNRLILCARTASLLRCGLRLLGIKTLEKM